MKQQAISFHGYPIVRVGMGQDSQRFLSMDSAKPCLVGGVVFEGVPGLASHSDGDVVFHAICHSVTSLTGVPIIGGIADKLCHKHGITDSGVYVTKGMELLGNQVITQVSISLEGKRPRFAEHLEQMCKQIAKVVGVNDDQVGITATSGEGLTDFGCGDGIQCWCVMTTMEGG